ncbi:hypothetical protein M9H77_04257 [Catharanthus roseus]|uniref:Uncharacterized protein n=1 Tax=Catharanthus roseus TaxID=4058 RepID=A0ACC0CDK5_CATRO|nr:hypothetical protein M9H77_04257 [Catharanthus roseus]
MLKGLCASNQYFKDIFENFLLVVYGFNPLTLFDLVPLPIDHIVSIDGKWKAEFVKSILAKVHNAIVAGINHGLNRRQTLDVKRTNSRKVLDLSLTVGPAPTVANRVLVDFDLSMFNQMFSFELGFLRHLIKHRRLLVSCATSLGRIGTTAIMPSKGFEGLKKTRSHLGTQSSQTLGTTSKPLSYKNLKLPLLCGNFGHYDYEAWDQKVESFFYSYCVREEEKFQLVLKSLPYEVIVWWDSKCENGRRMGVQPIKTWLLMKESLWNRFGVGNHEGQRQGQPKVKSMELSMVEESQKIKEFHKLGLKRVLKSMLWKRYPNRNFVASRVERAFKLKKKKQKKKD